MRCGNCGARAKSATCARCRRTGFSAQSTQTQPRNGHQQTTQPSGFTAIPQAADPHTLKLHALVAFEDAITAQAAVSGVSDQLEKQFDKYQKLKALALNAGTDHEANTAMRMCLIEAVKMVF